MFLGQGVCCLSEGSAGLRGVAGLPAHEIHDPGGLSLCSSLQHPQGERGRPGGQWVSGVPWEWDLVSEPGTHSQPLPCLPPHPYPLPPIPPQEHLSGSLAALRSNQIIILKVCRFWKIFGPLW